MRVIPDTSFRTATGEEISNEAAPEANRRESQGVGRPLGSTLSAKKRATTVPARDAPPLKKRRALQRGPAAAVAHLVVRLVAWTRWAALRRRHGPQSRTSLAQGLTGATTQGLMSSGGHRERQREPRSGAEGLMPRQPLRLLG